MPLEKSGDAPATRDWSRRPVKRKLASTAERHFVDDLADQGIRRVEVRQAVIGGRIIRVLVDIDARSVTSSGTGIERFRPGVIDLEAQPYDILFCRRNCSAL